MTSNTAFYKITLDLKTNLFNELLNVTDFESVTKGRIGNHLVNADENGVPIVRTTTKYNIPAHNFSAVHHNLVDSINNTIKDSALPALRFNNALIEVYNASYFKMNYHSDQSLDLDNDSYIGVFSCYENPDGLTEQHIRKLKIRDKVSDEEFEYSLTHNSVILFSVSDNTKFLHKIVLDTVANSKPSGSDNKWLGITFRTSKTYIKFEDNGPHFSNGDLLELANKEQEMELYKLRGQENRSVDFVYPDLTYTVNIADMMIPKNS